MPTALDLYDRARIERDLAAANESDAVDLDRKAAALERKAARERNRKKVDDLNADAAVLRERAAELRKRAQIERLWSDHDREAA